MNITKMGAPIVGLPFVVAILSQNLFPLLGLRDGPGVIVYVGGAGVMGVIANGAGVSSPGQQ